MSTKPYNILILYDKHSTYTNTLREYLQSFGLYSKNNIFYLSATNMAECDTDFSVFDAIILHYSIRVCYEWHISPYIAEKLMQYKGPKVLFMQDDYEFTETSRRSIEKLGLTVVFTCVPSKYIPQVFPPERFPGVKFINVFYTGYVSTSLERKNTWKPLEERTCMIGYRGRRLPYWYGNQGQDKINIGIQMKAHCQQFGIDCDIEIDDDKRIYGEDWYKFLENCRVTLGTETGSNVFDDDGSLKRDIKQSLDKNPNLTYEEAFDRFLFDKEGKIIMNQIAPKVFESIALKTAMILYEGEYSGVIEPYKHYIPLKKDFSNIDDVFRRLKDDEYIKEITERAYQDVIASKKYNYQWFVGKVDDYLDLEVTNPKGYRMATALIGLKEADNEDAFTVFPININNPKMETITNSVLTSNDRVCQIDNNPKPRKKKKSKNPFVKIKAEFNRFYTKKLTGLKTS